MTNKFIIMLSYDDGKKNIYCILYITNLFCKTDYFLLHSSFSSYVTLETWSTHGMMQSEPITINKLKFHFFLSIYFFVCFYIIIMEILEFFLCKLFKIFNWK